MTASKTGYAKAFATTIEKIAPLATEPVSLQDCVGRVTAENVYSKVDAPSADSSLKDGYAINASHILDGQADQPVRLPLLGSSAAGQDIVTPIPAGTAMRILTGARIPSGADTVVAEEFVQVTGKDILLTPPIKKGQDILPKGNDIKTGDQIVKKGRLLTPGMIGYLTTGGCRQIKAYKQPKVAIIATGDEILLPGSPLTPGKLYASNILTVNGWCRHFGMTTSLEISKDNQTDLENCLQHAQQHHDAVITSGGAWTGDKDLTARTLGHLGWEKCFHRIRLGPGKAVGFGLLNQTPVFILPGGPPSNLVTFLTLALPGLLKLAGFKKPGLPQIPARLSQTVKSQEDWTHAEFGTLEKTESEFLFHPIPRRGSRLKSIATAQGLLLIPEGASTMKKDDAVLVYDLRL